MNPSIPDIKTLVAENLCFSHLTVEHGLSHNVANNVVQDRWSFVWISTFGGLSRFDGYEVKVFCHDPDDPHIRPHQVFGIASCRLRRTGRSRTWQGKSCHITPVVFSSHACQLAGKGPPYSRQGLLHTLPRQEFVCGWCEY